MKKTVLFLLISFIGISFNVNAQHYDFSTRVGYNTLYFKITDSLNRNVEVRSQFPDYPYYTNTRPVGAIELTETFLYAGETYNITSIGNSAFINSIDISSINIPPSILSIGDFAFSGCVNLSLIYSNSIYPSPLQDSTFHGVSKTIPVYVPCTSLSSYQNNTLWSEFTNFQCFDIEEYSFTSVINGKNFYFKIIDSVNNYVEMSPEITISPYYLEDATKPSGALIILDSIIGGGITYIITSIGDYAFARCHGINSVQLTSSISSIGKYSFFDCDSLRTITLPKTITSIGEGAFSFCNTLDTINYNIINPILIDLSLFGYSPALTTLNVGKDVQIIPDFYPIRLTDINVDSNNSHYSSNSGLLYNKNVDTLLQCPAQRTNAFTIPNTVTTIGKSAFNGCSYLSSIILPNSITSIEASSFNYCSSLSSITLPNSLTKIGNYAFAHCRGLTSISIPSSVISIQHNAFNSCNSLTSVNLSNSLTQIEHSTFFSCYELSSIDIPNSITKIGSSAFYRCLSLSSVSLPDSLKKIESSTFYNCIALTSIDLPSTLETIESTAFNETGLSSITIPNSILSIGDGAFGNCIYLDSVMFFAENPTYTGASHTYPFRNCNNLKTVIIGENVQNIPAYAFAGLTNLTSITSNPITPPTIKSTTFFDVPRMTPLYVPCPSIESYKNNYYWSLFNNYQCIIGLNEILSTETQTKLYPNPTKGNTILELEGLTTSAEVLVYDIMGRKVNTYNLRPNQTELKIDLTGFAKGIYQVKVLNQTKKLIVN